MRNPEQRQMASIQLVTFSSWSSQAKDTETLSTKRKLFHRQTFNLKQQDTNLFLSQHMYSCGSQAHRSVTMINLLLKILWNFG